MTSPIRKDLYFSSICAAVACLAAGLAASAQQTSLSTVMGELRMGRTAVWGELTIEIERVTGGNLVTRAYVRPDGGFEIRDVPGGIYQVSVVDGQGEAIWHELMPIGPGATPLIIELDRAGREQSGAGTVSIARLRQKPSPAAVHELKLAERASGKGRVRESMQHLRRAVELAPNMQDAGNNLGAKYLLSGEYEAARRELEAAVALDPEAPVPHANLALALVAAGRANEAAAEARMALRRDPLLAGANFAGGAALAEQGKFDEAFPLLERAAERVPEALLIEARILFARSQTADAAAKLRSYLSRPGVPHRAEVTGWLNGILSGGAR